MILVKGPPGCPIYLRFLTAFDHVDRLELEHVVSSARLQSESVRAMLH